MESLREKFETTEPLPMKDWYCGTTKDTNQKYWIQLIRLDNPNHPKQLSARNQLATGLSHSAIYPCDSLFTVATADSYTTIEVTYTAPESTLFNEIEMGKIFSGPEIVNLARTISSALCYAKATKRLSHGNLGSEYIFRVKDHYSVAGWFTNESPEEESKTIASDSTSSSYNKRNDELNYEETKQTTIEPDFSQDVYSLGVIILEAANFNVSNFMRSALKASDYLDLVAEGIKHLSKKTGPP